jgi:hypothetical protein
MTPLRPLYMQSPYQEHLSLCSHHLKSTQSSASLGTVQVPSEYPQPGILQHFVLIPALPLAMAHSVQSALTSTYHGPGAMLAA